MTSRWLGSGARAISATAEGASSRQITPSSYLAHIQHRITWNQSRGSHRSALLEYAGQSPVRAGARIRQFTTSTSRHLQSSISRRDIKAPPGQSSIETTSENAESSIVLPKVSSDHGLLEIGWTDGRSSRFHNRYLFDHCRCEKCMHQATKQRLKQLVDIPADITTKNIEVTESGVTITWATPDSHQSSFPWSFLHRASYDPVLEEEDSVEFINREIATNIEYASLVPSEAVSEEQADRGVLRWLTRINDFGFCFVSGMPVNPEATEALIRRIDGGFWDFTADLKHGDMAYTNEALPAHTDNTYFVSQLRSDDAREDFLLIMFRSIALEKTDPSGLQCFHLLSHPSPGKGGASLLVDGFYAASILNELHPTAYATLSRLAIPCHASGSPDTLLRPHAHPVLQHDAVTGELIQVRWNNEDRGILGRGWRAEDVEAWYDAAMKWEEVSRNPDAEFWVQLSPGTMVVIDNWRVMHGRSAFTGARRMCGAYVGHDDWRSRLEVLKRRFGNGNGKNNGSVKDAQSQESIWEVGW